MKFKQKKYDECIEILNKKIIKLFESKIKQKNNKFLYSNIINLMNVAKQELGIEENSLLKKFYLLKREKCDNEFELYELIKIYDKLTQKKT